MLNNVSYRNCNVTRYHPTNPEETSLKAPSDQEERKEGREELWQLIHWISSKRVDSVNWILSIQNLWQIIKANICQIGKVDTFKLFFNTEIDRARGMFVVHKNTRLWLGYGFFLTWDESLRVITTILFQVLYEETRELQTPPKNFQTIILLTSPITPTYSVQNLPKLQLPSLSLQPQNSRAEPQTPKHIQGLIV